MLADYTTDASGKDIPIGSICPVCRYTERKPGAVKASTASTSASRPTIKYADASQPTKVEEGPALKMFAVTADGAKETTELNSNP